MQHNFKVLEESKLEDQSFHVHIDQWNRPCYLEGLWNTILSLLALLEIKVGGARHKMPIS